MYWMLTMLDPLNVDIWSLTSFQKIKKNDAQLYMCRSFTFCFVQTKSLVALELVLTLLLVSLWVWRKSLQGCWPKFIDYVSVIALICFLYLQGQLHKKTYHQLVCHEHVSRKNIQFVRVNAAPLRRVDGSLRQITMGACVCCLLLKHDQCCCTLAYEFKVYWLLFETFVFKLISIDI